MHDFLATSPFTERAEPVLQGFLIIIEGEKYKHEEIQNICHQNDQIHKLLMIFFFIKCTYLAIRSTQNLHFRKKA